MKKLSFALMAATTGVVMAAIIASPALAWHPQGKITKTVQDITTNSSVSSATSADSALNVAPGDTLRYAVVVSNAAAPAGNHDNDMAFTVMTDTLPTGVELVSNPAERTITENIGTILPGASVTKQYEVKVTSTTDGDVITNKACFTGNSIVKDNPQSGCATVVVKVHAPATPTYSCDQLSITQGANRTVTINRLDVTAVNGAAFKNAVIDWGDGSTPLTTTNAATQTYQYAADGTYKIVATAHFTVNGSDQAVTSANCAATATFTTATPPAVLPNTGAGSVIVPAGLASIVSYAFYAWYLKRRAAAQR
jgi:uncharacterized repeat protein (TIGR01451 family)